MNRFVSLSLALSLFLPAARAAESPDSAKARNPALSGFILLRKSELGKPIRMDWKVQSAWVFTPGRSPEAPWGAPALKLWIGVPARIMGARSTPVSASSVKAVSARWGDPGASPFALAPDVGGVIEVETREDRFELKTVFRDGLGGLRSLDLSVQVEHQSPSLIFDPTCARMGVDVRSFQIPRIRDVFYVGVRCTRLDSGERVATLFHSSDARFQAESFFERGLYEQGGFTFPIEANLGEKFFSLTSARTRHQARFTAFSVYVEDAEARPSAWGFQLGTSGTYFSLSEVAARDLDFNAVALTLTGAVFYRLVPGLWDVSLSGHMSALVAPARRQPVGDEFARFYALNARIGRRLGAIRDWTFYLNLGFYFSSIATQPAEAESVQITGPQLFLSWQQALASGKGAFGFLKLTPIATSVSLFDLSNRELAFGLGYRWPGEGRKTHSVSLDYSALAYDNAENQITIGLKAFSLGYQLSF